MLTTFWKFKSVIILTGILCSRTFVWAQTVDVSTSSQLQKALLAALPGQTIQLANGLYKRKGGFYVPAGINGYVSAPIKLVGSANAIISSDSLRLGYGLGLRGNSYWILEGFSVCKSKKGVVLDRSHHNTLSGLTIKNIGDEGIHLRTYSSYDTIENCYFDSLGLVTASCGEGIYIGSAKDNWATFSNGNPDTCNYNVVKANVFGDHIVSENIDIKEGTKCGLVTQNRLNGTGLNNVNGGDSWIDVKGNYYTIKLNVGHNSTLDGFQTHILVEGWGNYNCFERNTINVNGPGYGIKIVSANSVGVANDNKVCSSNVVTNAALGLTNMNPLDCSLVPKDTSTAIKEISIVR